VGPGWLQAGPEVAADAGGGPDAGGGWAGAPSPHIGPGGGAGGIAGGGWAGAFWPHIGPGGAAGGRIGPAGDWAGGAPG
jgi:hypothetical protein